MISLCSGVVWHRLQGSATLANVGRASTLTRSIEYAKETGSFHRSRPEPDFPSRSCRKL
ncbi:MAG: hypothetical protein LZF62_230012 [Nitrospira sp.]|nr:MAG: hypothetical protein LZF62_230012 [Nitrospira sp.]